ncbi:MAG TPA: response regulator transcription factor [Blastocatellia bacterium]
MTKFLLVEDNADMRQALRQMLIDLGEVYEYGNGEDAFLAYTQYQPDWVLMDIKLGRTNGIAAISSIKAAFPEARIVMVTMYGDEELREAARQAGACGYVLKENLTPLLMLFRQNYPLPD